MEENYLIIVEGGKRGGRGRQRQGYSAYVPMLPGCVSAAPTRALLKQRIRDAIEFHLEGMAEDEAEGQAQK